MIFIIMITYIYCLKHPLTNEIRYVGKTTSPKRRYKEHIYKLNKSDHKTNWVKLLLSAGLKPVMDILEECTDNWDEREKYWITQFNNLTNLTDGGEKFKVSSETKEKIRLANLGKKLTPETREKLRTIDTGENNPNFGKRHVKTAEAKEKISNALKGKFRGKPVIVKVKRERISKPCVIDGVQYQSVNKASKELNIPKGTIHRRLSSNNFSNYIWLLENNILPLQSQIVTDV